MATPKSISKMRVASRVCKLSAWVIGVIGIVAVGIYVSTIIPVIPFFRQSQVQDPYAYTALTSLISALFLIIVPTLFFTIILYAMGTLIEYLTSETKPDETERFLVEEEEGNDGRLEIVPLPEMR